MDKIICIGKNYLEHAKELGDAIPEKPVLFLKPPSTVLQSTEQNKNSNKDKPATALIPKNKGSLHHECEIAVRLNSKRQITDVTLGLDMTLRDLQAALKNNGHPWEISKTFQHSVILGPWIPLSQFKNYLETPFQFILEGRLAQTGQGTQMRLSPQQCIDYAAEYFPLCEGDIIMTGTPAGVGPVLVGQKSQLVWGAQLHYEVLWSESGASDCKTHVDTE